MTDESEITDLDRTTLEAFKTFKERATEVFLAPDPKSKDEPIADEQRGYALACMLLTTFLVDSGETFIAKRFMGLSEALIDLPRGVAHPLLKPAKRNPKGGRSFDRTAVWKIRADLCGGIQIMAAGDVQIDHSIAAIAKDHRDSLAKLLRPNTTLESSLRGWVTAFEMYEVDNPFAAGHYQTYKRQLETSKMQMPRDKLRLAGESIVLRAVREAKALL